MNDSVTFNGITLPSKFPPDFLLNHVFDYEQDMKGMGMGKSFEFFGNGAKAFIYIYDKNIIVPNDVDDDIVLSEYAYAFAEVQNYGGPGFEILGNHNKVIFNDVVFANNAFGYVEDVSVVSLLFLTSLRGSFVKLRYTFINDEHVKIRQEAFSVFMGEFSKVIKQQK